VIICHSLVYLPVGLVQQNMMVQKIFLWIQLDGHMNTRGLRVMRTCSIGIPIFGGIGSMQEEKRFLKS
jgi:hypothetical protein